MNNNNEEQLIGQVTHYFDRLSVAIIKLSKPLRAGETLHYKGAKTDFVGTVTSMEIEHQAIDEAKVGDEIGMKVDEKVREGDRVYKVE